MSNGSATVTQTVNTVTVTPPAANTLSVTSTSGGALALSGTQGNVTAVTLSPTSANLTLASVFAPLNSPQFTGVPTAPTLSTAGGVGSTQIATTAYVRTEISNLIGSAPNLLDTLDEIANAINDDATFHNTVTGILNLKAPLANPVFTGNPQAPTPTAGDNDTSIATTAFVTTAIAPKAPLASPAFSGVPTAPTANAGTNTTQIATTAFVTAAVGLENTLAEMNDVTISNIDNGEFLQYDSSALKWINLSATDAGILPLAGGTMTGNLTLSYAYPRINLTDTNNDSDYSIINNDGSFSIYDVTNASHRFLIAANGNATFAETVTGKSFHQDTQVNSTFYGATFDSDVTVGGSLSLHTTNTVNYLSSQSGSKDLILRNTGSGKDMIFQVTAGGTAELLRLRGVSSKEIVAAGNFEIRNGSSARHIYLYETYTDTSNYERSFFKHASSFLEIGTEALGTGTASGIKVRTTGVTALSIAAGGLVTVESRNSASSTNILSVGGSNNGYMSVRHVEGKNSSSNAYGPIYINHLSNNNVFLASGGGGVGIGTTSSLSFKLDVQNSLGGAIARFKDTDSSHDGIRIEGGTGGGIISNASGLSKEALYFQNDLNALRIYTNGGERMRIDSAGRVGFNETGVSSYDGDADDLVIKTGGNTGVTLRTSSTGTGSIFFADGISGAERYQGTIRYFHNGNVMTFGTSATERMRIDSVGRVGIGDTSPDYLLTVKASGADIELYDTATDGNARLFIRAGGSSGNSQLFFGDDADNDIGKIRYRHSGNSMAFETNGSERMRITGGSDGYVGIGCIPTSTKLEVKGGTSGTSAYGFLVRNSSNTSLFSIRDDGRIDIPVGPVVIDTNTVYVDTTNNRVGIGTTSPALDLHVVGQVRVDNNNGVAARQIRSSYFSSGQDLTLTAGSAAAVKLKTGSTVHLTVNNNGRVGIGTTNPDYKLDVAGDIGIGDYAMMKSTAQYMGMIGFNRNGNTGAIYNNSYGAFQLQNNNGVFEFQCYNSSGVVQAIHKFTSDGRVGINTTPHTNQQFHIVASSTDTTGLEFSASQIANETRILSYDRGSGGGYRPLRLQSSHLKVEISGTHKFAVTSTGASVTGRLSASEVAVTNIVTNKLVKFNGTLLDDSSITDDGSTVTVGGNLTVQGDISTTGSFTIVDTDVSTTEQLSITNDGTGPALIVNQTGVQPIVDFKDDGTSVFNILNGGDIVMTGDLRLPDGTASSPSLTFSGHTNTGIYWSNYTTSPQKDQINFAVDGATKAYVNEAGVFSTGNVYAANAHQFRTFQEWQATTGGSGYGFKFRNTADSVDCLVISATGNLNPAGNITMADNGKVIATRKLIARDNAGLLLAEDSAATGIFINDSGNTTIQGTLTMASNGTGNSASSQEIIFYGTNSGGSQIDQATIFSTKYHYNTNAGDLVFKTGNTSGTQSERMRINGVGNVGIGTDFPSSKFHLSTSAISQQGTPVTAITKTIATTSIGAKLSFTNAHNANGNLIGGMSMGNTGEEFAGLYAVDGGASAATHLAFFTGNTTATTEAIRILSDGNVGIGVTAPSQKLEVGTNTDVSAQIGRVHVGYFGFGDYAGFAHLDKASTSAYALIQGAAGDTHLNAANGQNLFFRQNHVTVGGFNTSSDFYVDTDTLYVDASTDRVGIGTNSPAAPLSLVGVNGGSWNDGLIIDDPSGWAATVYKRSNSPKMFTGLYSGNDNYIWMSTGYSNSGTTITAPRADAVLMARPSTDDLQIYLETHFGNNVGIATTAPTCKLQVDEYTVGSNGNQDSGIATAAIFTNSGSDGLYLGVKNASYPNRGYAFKVTSNGVNSDFTIKEHGLSGDRFKIFTGGKIEQNYISYTDSSNYEALQISGESDHIRFTSKTVGSFASNNRNFKFYQNGSIRAEISPNGVTAYSTFYISSGGAFRAYGHDSIISTGGGDYDIKFNLNDQEKVRFKANGNVGIGNTDPTQAKLQVSGGSVLIDAYNATGTHGLFFRSGFVTSNQYNLSITCHNDGDGSSDALDINAYDGIYFNTGANTRANQAFINSSGKFCINQTDTSSDYLQVTGANGLYAARFNGSSTGGNSYGLRVRAGTNENDISFIAENTSGVDLFRVSGNGNVAIGNVTPTSKLYIHSGAFSSGEGEIRNDARVNRNYKLALGTTTKYIGTVQMNGNGDSSGFHVRIYDGHSKVWREVNVVIQNSGGTNFPKVTVEGGGDDVNINVEFAYVNRSGAAQKTDFYLVPTVNKTYTQLIFVDGYIERDTGHSSTSSTNINLDTAVGIYKAATDDSSKIGIGTVDPDQKLHIKGDALRIEESASVTGRHLDIIPAVSGQPHKFTSTSTGSGYHFENSNGLIASFEEANTNFHQNVDITSGDLFFNTNGKGLHFDGVGNWDFRMRTLDSGSGNVPLIFESQNGNSSSPVERFRINSNGNALFSQNLTVNGTFEVSTLATPNAPTNLSLSVVGETINVTFTASTTSNIDSYLVYSSVDGGDYGLISIIPPEDFGSTMSIIDSAFAVTGTQAYRVYAVKAGKLSSALTGNISYTVSSAEPTNLSVVALNNAFYIQYDPPSSNSRFVTAYKIFKHEHATQNSLDRTQASEIYSGMNKSYMYQISGSNNTNFHQFWVETTIAT